MFAYTISFQRRLGAGQAIDAALADHGCQWQNSEVNGEGVVGEHPHLHPGDSFRYTSAAMIETPVGVMQGKYQMVSDTGENFSAAIPKFTLSIPRTLH